MAAITVNPEAARVSANQIKVKGTYESASDGQVSVTVTQDSRSGKMGKNVTAGAGEWEVTVTSAVWNPGTAQAHAVLNQGTPPETASADETITIP
jgi:hypothetical protein